MAQEKVLEVKNLTISFKTDHGLVRAVRGVSFDLHKGETLCIVGESGSGKSVTSKTVMGILSANAVVESGSIMYEGENLLEISEESYVDIRGKKIGMIFQDPMSSLNPIMRIGKQITEATILNGNQVKKLYEDIIRVEKTAYNNCVTKYKLTNENLKRKYKDFVNAKKAELKEKPELKEQITAEILAKKAEYKEALAENKAQFAQTIPGIKEKLNVKKAEAKEKVNQYKETCKAEYEAKVAELQNSITDQAELKKALKAEKDAYVLKLKITRSEAKRRAIEIMKEVGIPMPEKRFKQYPFEFSGGMRQRIVIAIALTASPDVIICDEPTTALDVTIQAQILELINKLKRERNLSCIFITHDLGVVANMADRVAVMYAGKIVEYGLVNEIFYEPKHPYTWALLSSIPDVDSKEKLEAIPGTPPDMIYPPKGDAFALRSRYAMAIDYKYQPPFFKVSDTHYAATWLLHPNAPKVEMPKIVAERIKKSLENGGTSDEEK